MHCTLLCKITDVQIDKLNTMGDLNSGFGALTQFNQEETRGDIPFLANQCSCLVHSQITKMAFSYKKEPPPKMTP